MILGPSAGTKMQAKYLIFSDRDLSGEICMLSA